MIYIQTDFNHKIIYIHHFPFDEKCGMGKTKEELLQSGFLVDEIPQRPSKDGYTTISYYTKEKGFYYEYKEFQTNVYGIPEEVTQQIQDDMTLALIESGAL